MPLLNARILVPPQQSVSDDERDAFLRLINNTGLWYSRSLLRGAPYLANVEVTPCDEPPIITSLWQHAPMLSWVESQLRQRRLFNANEYNTTTIVGISGGGLGRAFSSWGAAWGFGKPSKGGLSVIGWREAMAFLRVPRRNPTASARRVAYLVMWLVAHEWGHMLGLPHKPPDNPRHTAYANSSIMNYGSAFLYVNGKMGTNGFTQPEIDMATNAALWKDNYSEAEAISARVFREDVRRVIDGDVTPAQALGAGLLLEDYGVI